MIRDEVLVKVRWIGATFQATVQGQPQPIFWAFPKYVQALMTTLTRPGAPLDVVARYRESLAALPGFNSARTRSDARPATNFSEISETEIRTLVNESNKVVEAWRRAVS